MPSGATHEAGQTDASEVHGQQQEAQRRAAEVLTSGAARLRPRNHETGRDWSIGKHLPAPSSHPHRTNHDRSRTILERGQTGPTGKMPSHNRAKNHTTKVDIRPLRHVRTATPSDGICDERPPLAPQSLAPTWHSSRAGAASLTLDYIAENLI